MARSNRSAKVLRAHAPAFRRAGAVEGDIKLSAKPMLQGSRNSLRADHPHHGVRLETRVARSAFHSASMYSPISAAPLKRRWPDSDHTLGIQDPRLLGQGRERGHGERFGGRQIYRTHGDASGLKLVDWTWVRIRPTSISTSTRRRGAAGDLLHIVGRTLGHCTCFRKSAFGGATEAGATTAATRCTISSCTSKISSS